MPTESLPTRPSLENLKKQAKALHRGYARGDGPCAAVAREFLPHLKTGVDFSLADAQLVVARKHGFASWPQLKQRVESLQRYTRSPHVDPVTAEEGFEGAVNKFLRLACLIYGADSVHRRDQARAMVSENRALATAN